jgi:hypothetical protein
VDGLDVHQQRVVAQMAPLRGAGCPHEVLVVPGHAHLSTRHCTEIGHTPGGVDEGVLHFAAFREVRRRFSQDVALHLHARQLRPQPADLHLLRAHDLAVSAP